MSELGVGSILNDSVQPKPTRRPARAHRHDDAVIAAEVRRLTRGQRNAEIRFVAGLLKAHQVSDLIGCVPRAVARVIGKAELVAVS